MDPPATNQPIDARARMLTSLGMLAVQRETFRGLDPKTWRNYHLFFGSFDAVVLVASIFILFPNEHIDRAGRAREEAQWALAGTAAPMNGHREVGNGSVFAFADFILKRLEMEGKTYSSTAFGELQGRQGVTV